MLMPALPALPIVKTTLRAIAQAHGDYKSWSGGDWLWKAPEYMATTSIARALHRLPVVKYVTMENNVRDAIEDAGGSLVGRPNRKLNLEGRFDLVVWNTRGPRALIEVKTNPRAYAPLCDDIHELCAALAKAADIHWALVAYYDSFRPGEYKNARERLRDHTNGIWQRALDVVPSGIKITRHQSAVRSSGRSAWTAEALEIRRA